MYAVVSCCVVVCCLVASDLSFVYCSLLHSLIGVVVVGCFGFDFVGMFSVVSVFVVVVFVFVFVFVVVVVVVVVVAAAAAVNLPTILPSLSFANMLEEVSKHFENMYRLYHQRIDRLN